MKRRLTKFLALVICISMVAAALMTGCSRSDGSQTTTTTTTRQTTTAATTTTGGSTEPTEETAFKFDETLEFSYLLVQNQNYDENTVIIEEIENRLNVSLDLVWTPLANYSEKLNAIIASNEIPECIAGADFNIMLRQGVAIELDELLDNYGPNITRFYDPEDYVFLRHFEDGKIYRLMPIFDFPQAYSVAVRADWLAKFNLSMPETLDEWVDVLTVFRDEDANGDGDPNNEIPWVIGVGGMLPFLNAYGIMPSGGISLTRGGGFFTLYNNELIPYFEHPNYRAYLEKMSWMFTERLLDNEFASRLGNMSDQYLVIDSSIGGAGFVYSNKTQVTTEALRENDPNVLFAPAKPIKGPFGDQNQLARAKFSTSAITYITVSAEAANKADKIMQFWNWMFSDEGLILLNYGLEGVHHDVVNGDHVLKPEFNADFGPYRRAGLGYQPFTINWLEDAYMQIATKGKAYEELSETEKLFYDGLYISKPYFYQSIPTFNTKTAVESGTEIFSQLDSLEARAISAQITADQFFTEYERIKGIGFDKIIEETQEAFARTMGN